MTRRQGRVCPARSLQLREVKLWSGCPEEAEGSRGAVANCVPALHFPGLRARREAACDSLSDSHVLAVGLVCKDCVLRLGCYEVVEGVRSQGEPCACFGVFACACFACQKLFGVRIYSGHSWKNFHLRSGRGVSTRAFKSCALRNQASVRVCVCAGALLCVAKASGYSASP